MFPPIQSTQKWIYRYLQLLHAELKKKIMRQNWGNLVYPSRALRFSLSLSLLREGIVRFVVESRTRSLIPHLTACPKQMDDSGNWHQRLRYAAAALSPEMEDLHPSSHAGCQAPDDVKVTKEDFCKSTYSWGQCAPVLKCKWSYIFLFCTIILLNVTPSAVAVFFFQDFTWEKRKFYLLINSRLEKKLHICAFSRIAFNHPFLLILTIVCVLITTDQDQHPWSSVC